MTLNPNITSVTAFAPATLANVIVGFDILGMPLPICGDRVTVSRNHLGQCRLRSICGTDHRSLPMNPMENTATKALLAMCDGLKLSQGFDIEIDKGIAMASGLGGSAASAVATVVAANHFLQTPCNRHTLAEFALAGEQAASGDRHADNVVPCLWGELTLVSLGEQLLVTVLPMPKLWISVVLPKIAIPTHRARALLCSEVTLGTHTRQSANLARMVHALHINDWQLLKQACEDHVIEPQRSGLLPGYAQMKTAAMDSQALCMGFSGAGPAVFALAENEVIATAVSSAMHRVATTCVGDCEVLTQPLQRQGARVIRCQH